MIIFAVWLIGAILSYKFVISKWDDTKFNKIWLSAFWFLTWLLFPIHWIHNK